MRILPIIFSIFLVVSATQKSSATSIYYQNLDRLVKRASKIVIGKVIAKRSYYGKGNRIYTESTVRIQNQLLHREPIKEIKIHSLGGTIGKVGMKVIGSPKLALNQDILVFCEKRNNRYFVVGMKQGVFFIHQKSTMLYVSRDLRGLHIIDQPLPAPNIKTTDLDANIPLKTLIARIQEKKRILNKVQ